jgi:peptide/nickel transport system substrate-binding protein
MADGSFWSQSRISRRRVTAGGAGGLALIAAATLGCGRTKGRPAGSSAAGRPSASLSPTRGGYLRHMLPYSAANIDPDTTEDLVAYGFTEMDWYEPLVRIEYTPSPDWRIANRVIPWLAERIEQVDPTTYTFNIRQGVKFHSGDPLTAQDIVSSYSRIKDPRVKANPGVLRYVENLEKAEASDDYTVRITTKRPDADFLSSIASRNVVIKSRKHIDSGADLTKNAVGTGPFRLTSYQKDSTALGNRFPDYWLKSAPHLDGIKLVLKVDDATTSAAFSAGQVDILIRHDRKQAEPVLRANPKAVSESAPADQVYGVTFNQTRPPFSDERVRRAIHLVIDRQAADKAVNFGDGVICGPAVVSGKTGWAIPMDELLKLPGYRQPKAQDVADAKRLLAEAGFAAGFKTSIGFSSTTESQSGYAEVVQAQLKQVSIDATLLPWDNATYTQRRVKPEFDLLIVSEGGLSSPASAAYASFYSTGVYAKPTGIKDADLDQLLDSQGTEFDSQKRGAIFQKVERMVLEKVYKAPISTPLLLQLQQPWIHDWAGAKNNRAVIMNPDAIWMDLEAAPSDRRQST